MPFVGTQLADQESQRPVGNFYWLELLITLSTYSLHTHLTDAFDNTFLFRNILFKTQRLFKI